MSESGGIIESILAHCLITSWQEGEPGLEDYFSLQCKVRGARFPGSFWFTVK
jgi:hypothetical protein